MGNALQDQGKLDEAIEAYTKALSIKPDYADACCNMGNALQDQGKLDEAIEAYTKALSIKPTAEAHNNMGNALQDKGKLDEAIEAYTKALSIKPDFAEAYNNTSDLLKIYSYNGKKAHVLFKIDSKIKKLSPKLLNAQSNEEVINYLLKGLNH